MKSENPSRKEVQCWSEVAEDRLRDSSESMDWTVFKCSVENLDTYATTIMDFISESLHSSLEYLDDEDTYVRLLLVDYSSTFNIIIPTRLISKHHDLGLGSTLCNRILSFLTHRPHSVRI
eukprot:g30488.t1